MDQDPPPPKPIKSIKITRGIDARASYSKAVKD